MKKTGKLILSGIFIVFFLLVFNNCDENSANDPCAKGHDWDIVQAVLEPTCTADGYGTVNCIRQGCMEKIENDVIAKLGHAKAATPYATTI